MLSTSEAEELTGPEHRGEAVGGPRPQMVFHLLCFHTELPSSRLWKSALRASSDPPGSAFVTAHPSLSSSSGSCCLNSCSFHYFLSFFCHLFLLFIIFVCLLLLVYIFKRNHPLSLHFLFFSHIRVKKFYNSNS